MTLQEIRQSIIEEISELNANPSFENLGKVEASIDFYSDVYKDEYYVRPRNDIGYFRSLYSEEVRDLCEKWEELPWEEHLKYLRGY